MLVLEEMQEIAGEELHDGRDDCIVLAIGTPGDAGCHGEADWGLLKTRAMRRQIKVENVEDSKDSHLHHELC